MDGEAITHGRNYAIQSQDSRTTWHSPDGKVHNQIDFIFNSRRYTMGINRTRTRTFNKLDIGNGHGLAMMILKVKLKMNWRDKV